MDGGVLVSRAGHPAAGLTPPSSPPDYIVQFEEDRFQPGTWHNHSRYPGSVNSAVLSLSPYVNYQFRVIAVNDVGSSLPSVPSERYQTNGAREYQPPHPSSWPPASPPRVCWRWFIVIL